jgi:hypothetical protein
MLIQGKKKKKRNTHRYKLQSRAFLLLLFF